MYKRNKNIVARKVGESFFLIDITENYLDDKCKLYEINQVGKFIWDHLEVPDGLSGIVSILIDNIKDQLDYRDVWNDVNEYINVLIMQKFVIIDDCARE